MLPRVFATYPGSHQLLLDGAPVVKDVVFDRTLSTVTNSSVWHSALVASFGSEGVAGSQSNPAASGGYYALDVTNPDPKALGGGPKFLWQLTHMPKFNNAADVELFATHSATPALTTVYATLDGGSTTHEIAVAILPGGYDPAFSPNAHIDDLGQSRVDGLRDRAALGEVGEHGVVGTNLGFEVVGDGQTGHIVCGAVDAQTRAQALRGLADGLVRLIQTHQGTQTVYVGNGRHGASFGCGER